MIYANNALIIILSIQKLCSISHHEQIIPQNTSKKYYIIMGCTCKVQWGKIPEADYSHVILKVFFPQIIEEKHIAIESLPRSPEIHAPQLKLEENSTLKPEYLYINSPSHNKIHSLDMSKIDFSVTSRAFGSIIQEGELKKYRPGFTNQYISRWCVLTSEYFMYYKNRSSAQMWGRMPLYSVPIGDILNVTK